MWQGVTKHLAFCLPFVFGISDYNNHVFPKEVFLAKVVLLHVTSKSLIEISLTVILPSAFVSPKSQIVISFLLVLGSSQDVFNNYSNELYEMG